MEWENLAVRTNRHLILAATIKPFVYDLDTKRLIPRRNPCINSSVSQSTTGIAEIFTCIFAVIVGSFSNRQAVPGSFSIWSVDLNAPEPAVKLVTSISEAAGLNGMTRLDEDILMLFSLRIPFLGMCGGSMSPRASTALLFSHHSLQTMKTQPL